MSRAETRGSRVACDVTIAICTWNRSDLLQTTLESLTRLDVPGGLSWEVIVVDNASTDTTQQVAGSFASRLPLRVLLEAKKGLSHARNRALDEARGCYVLFTDDDVRVDEQWLAAFVEATARFPEATVLGGPIHPWFPVTPDPLLLEVFPEVRKGFCGLDHPGADGPIPPRAAIWGANMGYRVAGLDGLRFNPDLGTGQTGKVMFGEEVEYIGKLREQGAIVVWVPRMQLEHYVSPSRMTPQYLRAYREGQGCVAVRFEGRPPGRAVFGIPLWMIKLIVVSYAAYLWHSAFGHRRGALVGLRDLAFNTGMARELFAPGLLATRAGAAARRVLSAQ